jgi:hypothetical protein
MHSLVRGKEKKRKLLRPLCGIEEEKGKVWTLAL